MLATVQARPVIVPAAIAADLAGGAVLLSPGRAGQLVGESAAAVVRWARAGRRGVRLETASGPGVKWHTTAAAVGRFLGRTGDRP
jgi:hypothetical protein